MKYALVDYEKSEASKGLKGECQCCGAQMIAKCGKIKVNHWAHKGRRNCDKWWEVETDWHRQWKNMFPSKWQEILFKDENNNENHIADIFTKNGLIIEFQHSYINFIEQRSREQFYKEMIWVVDGGRLKNDYSRLVKHMDKFIRTTKPHIFTVNFPDECLPKNWVNCSVPVMFDFQNATKMLTQVDYRKYMYCLLPQRLRGNQILIEIPRAAFIKAVNDGSWEGRFNKFLAHVIDSDNYHKTKTKQLLLNMIEGLPESKKIKAKRYITLNGLQNVSEIL